MGEWLPSVQEILAAVPNTEQNKAEIRKQAATVTFWEWFGKSSPTVLREDTEYGVPSSNVKGSPGILVLGPQLLALFRWL